MIEGVGVEPLKQIEDSRGTVFHMLRSDSPHFQGFGEVYFSEVKPGQIKAWKRHQKMTQHVTVPVGSLRLVIFDDRPGSPTRGNILEYVLERPKAYFLVRIPPQVWYGFQALGDGPALIANCTDLPHDPAEGETLPPNSDKIPHQWKG